MQTLDFIPTFSDAVKAVTRACRKEGGRLRYEDIEELANDTLMRFVKAQENGKPYLDSKPIWKIARNLVIDRLRIKQTPVIALADISLPWVPKEKAEDVIDFLKKKWPAKERKLIDAIRDGVPPTPQHLHDSTGLSVADCKKLLRVIRETLKSSAIAELDQTIGDAAKSSDLSTPPSLLSVPVNKHHRAQLFVMFHRRCLAHALASDEGQAKAALFYATKFPPPFTPLNQIDPLLLTFLYLSEARSQLKSFELGLSAKNILLTFFVAQRLAGSSRDSVAMRESAQITEHLMQQIDSIPLNDKLHFAHFCAQAEPMQFFLDFIRSPVADHASELRALFAE